VRTLTNLFDYNSKRPYNNNLIRNMDVFFSH